MSKRHLVVARNLKVVQYTVVHPTKMFYEIPHWLVLDYEFHLRNQFSSKNVLLYLQIWG